MDSVRHWLSPQQILLDLDVSGKREALHAIAVVLERSCRVRSDPIFRALDRRERAGSTGVGEGFAIPHARISGIDEPVTLFARTKSPIQFGGVEQKSVSELFVILVPAEGVAERHLQILRAVAEMFSNRAFRASLLAATSAPAVAAVFARWAMRPDGAVGTPKGQADFDLRG
jgi:PTS system nitrogen regulatory IIA component